MLETAISIADERGLDTVSMRNVASQLGVTAMSLYNYFANKDEMIECMLDRVISEIELPEEPDWRTAIRISSISTRDALLRHPWASSIWLSQQGGMRTARLRHSDWLLRTLRRGGLSDRAVFHAFHILESFILGSTLQHLSFPYEGEELANIAQDFLSELPAEEYPDFADHVNRHLHPPTGDKTGFDFALALILDGLVHAREAGDQ